MRYLFLIITLTILTVPTIKFAYAQQRIERTPIPDSYQEYIYQLDNFYKQRTNYTTASNKYQSYQTILSKTEAQEAAKSMLLSGIQSLQQYALLTQQVIQDQPDFNSRVKNLISNDLNDHQTYLTNLSQTELTSTEQLETTSTALQQRAAYLKSTSEQAIAYSEAIKLRNSINQAKSIVENFRVIAAGYPETVNAKKVVENWATQTDQELVDSENIITSYLELVYPEQKETYYESNRNVDTNSLRLIEAKLKSYNIKFKEIENIIREAYQKL